MSPTGLGYTGTLWRTLALPQGNWLCTRLLPPLIKKAETGLCPLHQTQAGRHQKVKSLTVPRLCSLLLSSSLKTFDLGYLLLVDFMGQCRSCLSGGQRLHSISFISFYKQQLVRYPAAFEHKTYKSLRYPIKKSF